jgi:hypothetical protein
MFPTLAWHNFSNLRSPSGGNLFGFSAAIDGYGRLIFLLLRGDFAIARCQSLSRQTAVFEAACVFWDTRQVCPLFHF